MKLCRDFMMNKCTRSECSFSHEKGVCFHFWKHGTCKFGEECKKKHIRDNENSQHIRRPKNTESFQPLQKPVDMRIMFDPGTTKLSSTVSSRDVLLVPNLFSDFRPGEIYERLQLEMLQCGIPESDLLKYWHGDSHLIADDHMNWKSKAPTFLMVLDRMREFFNMDIQATRFNLYKDTSQWKPFHHDAAAVKPKQAATQNFTVAVSFGATRDAAFEENKSKTVISIPQPDGCIYAFAKDTNILWKHGILKEKETRNEGRISIIAWGWVNDQVQA